MADGSGEFPISIPGPTASEPTASVMGRPTDFRPEFIEQARKLCLLGATDDEIADFFEVSTRTIHRWKNVHPDFCHALQTGKEVADERVERSLYQMATGAYFVEQQAVKVKKGQYEEEVEIVDVERYRPPEVPAAIFWLKNRRRDTWRDRSETNFTNPDGTPAAPVINVNVSTTRDQSDPAS